LMHDIPESQILIKNQVNQLIDFII
jgi:hypothetical protein